MLRAEPAFVFFLLEEELGKKEAIISACEQVLWGAFLEKEGELATTSLEFKFNLQFPCGSPSTELSDFRQSARSGNEHKCKQTLENTWKHVSRVMTSLLMSSPPISISHRLFRCRYLNSRDVVALFPFPAPLSERPGELAWRLKLVSREISNFNTRREIFYLRAA